jgi:sialidase-1
LRNDGGVPWTPPADAPGLIEPVCQASRIRHEPGLLVFSNPAAKSRTQLTVRTRAAGAAPCRAVALRHAGPSAGSSLVSLDAKTLGCCYENGAKRPAERITFARVEVSAR